LEPNIAASLGATPAGWHEGEPDADASGSPGL